MKSLQINLPEKFRLHYASNEIDNSFVGIKVKSNTIDFYCPETYDFTFENLSQFRNNVLLILKTISLSKSFSSDKTKANTNIGSKLDIDIDSLLWIMRDFLIHGFYLDDRNIEKTNQKGRIDWKRTLETQPIISNRNIIYKDIIVNVRDQNEAILSDIYKLCVKKSFDLLWWVYFDNNLFKVDIRPFNSFLKRQYIQVLWNELGKTFNDEKKIRFENMLKIINGIGEDEKESMVYGVDSYEFVFEKLVDNVFSNDDVRKISPSSYWYLKKDLYKEKKGSNLRPDTILSNDRTLYIIDSKYYRYGVTGDANDLPDTSSIQKQITYGEFNRNRLRKSFDSVKNLFIVPYNKKDNNFGFSNFIEYIGYSKTNYKKNTDELEYIYAFLIDLKSLIVAWDNKSKEIEKEILIKIIEDNKISDKK